MYTRMLLWVPIRIGLGMLPLQCRRLGRSSESARHYILPAARRHRAATHNAPVSRRACGSGSGASDPRPIRVASAAECVAPAPYRRTNPAPGVPGPALRGRFKPTVAPRQSASLGRPRHPREGREDAEGGSRGGVPLRASAGPAQRWAGQRTGSVRRSAGDVPPPCRRRCCITLHVDSGLVCA